MKKYTLGTELETSIHNIDVKLYRVIYADDTIGGWIEKEENLSQDGKCVVLDEAIVYGDSRVEGDARISDNAIVYNSIVRNTSTIRTRAVVRNSTVYDNARIYGVAKVDNSTVFGDAIIMNFATVDESIVQGDAEVFNNAYVTKSMISGEASVYGDAIVNNSTIKDKAQVYGTTVVDDSVVKETAAVFGTTKVINKSVISDNAKLNNPVTYDNKKISASPTPTVSSFNKSLPTMSYAQTRIVAVKDVPEDLYLKVASRGGKIRASMSISNVVVPVIVPGTVHKFPSEVEVILPRGVTLKIESIKLVNENISNDAFVHWQTSVVSPKDISVNEVYDGDLFLKTGEMKLMSFGQFNEAKAVVKKESDYGLELFLSAVQLIQSEDKSLESFEQKERCAEKFGAFVG